MSSSTVNNVNGLKAVAIEEILVSELFKVNEVCFLSSLPGGASV